MIQNYEAIESFNKASLQHYFSYAFFAYESKIIELLSLKPITIEDVVQNISIIRNINVPDYKVGSVILVLVAYGYVF